MSVASHVDLAEPLAIQERRAFAAPNPAPALFWALLTFLVLEFLRPPIISQLKFQMLFVLAMPFLWYGTRDRPWSPVLSIQFGMLAHNAISVVYAENWFSAYMAARTVWAHVVAALAIVWLLQREKEFTRTIWIWALIMGFHALHAATIGGGRGYGGMMGDENDIAMGAGTAVPFMLMGFQLYKGWRRWACLAVLVTLIAGIVISDSRGGFVGLAGCVAYCIFAGKHRVRNLSVCVAGALIFFLSIPDSYKKELSTISDTQGGTAEARFFLWTAATKMWIDNPIFGVGGANSPWLIGQYQPQTADVDGGMFSGGHYTHKDWTTNAVHSVYFETLAEHGLVGVGCLGGLIWLHFAAVRRTRALVDAMPDADPDLRRDAELHGIALGGALFGYLVCGAFLSVLYYPYLYYFTGFSAAYQGMIGRRVAQQQESAAQRDVRATRDTAASSLHIEAPPPPAEPPAGREPERGASSLSALLAPTPSVPTRSRSADSDSER